MASVYWIRSLVPIETKSKCRRKRSIISAAAGTSIIAPTSTPAVGAAGIVELLARPRQGLERSACTSPRCATIGIRMRTLP